MTSDDKSRRDELAKQCLNAYFNGEEFLGHDVQAPDRAFKAGYDSRDAEVADLVKEHDKWYNVWNTEAVTNKILAGKVERLESERDALTKHLAILEESVRHTFKAREDRLLAEVNKLRQDTCVLVEAQMELGLQHQLLKTQLAAMITERNDLRAKNTGV